MRKDIQFSIDIQDMPIKPTNKYTAYPLQWIERPASGLSRYIYGEVKLPMSVSEESIVKNGLVIKIPYTPQYKEFQVRICRESYNGDTLPIYNPVDGSEWFVVQGANSKNLFASQLMLLSEEAFDMQFNGKFLVAYDADKRDVVIAKASRQNANHLLACYPGNNYRYPLAGVGLGRWINSNAINSSKLADRISAQFKEDGVSIRTASLNFDTMQINIDGLEQEE